MNEPDVGASVVDAIRKKEFWQGTVFSREDMVSVGVDIPESFGWWIVASQTCNLYNHSLIKVPHIELVGANKIGAVLPKFFKGNDPRILHVVATADDGDLHLESDLLHRIWLPRSKLSELPATSLRLRDSMPVDGSAHDGTNWNDLFSGWLGRSYTRVTLPDAFNEALKKSKLSDLLDDRLSRQSDQIYGIYLSLQPDDGSEWEGVLGLMPPPYNLGILIAVEENVDPLPIQGEWREALTAKKVKDPLSANPKATTSRQSRAEACGIRIRAEGIEAKNVAELTLLEVKGLVRYSILDHLSSADMAVSRDK